MSMELRQLTSFFNLESKKNAIVCARLHNDGIIHDFIVCKNYNIDDAGKLTWTYGDYNLTLAEALQIARNWIKA